ncbi:MAG: DUF2252 family protein [Candidatus Sericytochromatia bacterium]|nr:DUF2252 family protein [Candidatus Sericytochromatia bacterium]
MGGYGPLTKGLLIGTEKLVASSLKLVGKVEQGLGKTVTTGLTDVDHLLGKVGNGNALKELGLFTDTGAQAVTMSRPQVLSHLASDLSRRQQVNPAGLALKVKVLSSKPFAFFRGTAPQFYRRLFSEMPESLRNAPKTVLQGDVHIENFAVVPGNRTLTYGLTDFDEAIKGPASVDLVRGMSSVVVAAGEDVSLLKTFLKGYRKGLDGSINLKSDAIVGFLKKQGTISQAEMLAERTMKNHTRIKPNATTLAVPKALKSKIAKALTNSDIPNVAKKDLQDIVQVHAGTGSLDLFRYEGVLGKGSQKDVIVEMKELLPSSLSPHLGAAGNDLKRYQEALAVYQGQVAAPVTAIAVDGRTFLTRTRPAYKGGIKFDDVKPGDRVVFLEDLGKILGKAHANGGNGPQLASFVQQHESDLLATAINQARHSIADFKTFLSR